MSNYVEFKSIIKQAKVITYVYKMVGLYSTLLLTVATIISMTNVFTRGQFSDWPNVATIWAIVFSTAIDVNILRMFIDAYIERSKTAFTIGLGLGFVTGAALLIERLQQSIGLDWNNTWIKWTIGILIVLRVMFVIVLLAREGTKLGKMIVNVLQASEQAEQDGQKETPERTDSTDKIPHSAEFETERTGTDTELRIRGLLVSAPDKSVRQVAKQVGVSPSTAGKWMQRIREEAKA